MKIHQAVAVTCTAILSLSLAKAAPTAQEEIPIKVAQARAILDPWLAQNPVPGDRRLHVVLWTPNDREPAPRYRERLSELLHDIRDFYGSEMERLGFGRRSINFHHSDDGMIDILLVRGRNPYSHYRTESGAEIRSECLQPLRQRGVDADRETVVIFCNMSNWDAEKMTISQNSPYYAGGTHRNGTAWQVDSPILDLSLLADKEPMVRDGQYGHISVGRYNSIFIGGVCHELGHALGLPHNLQRPDEQSAFGTALMGSGNRTYGEQLRGEGRGSFLTLAHGLRLASHPMFSGSIKEIDRPASAVPSELAVKTVDDGFIFSGKVTADPPVYGVVAYMDPDGGGDYDATTATAVPDQDGRFSLHCNAFKPGKNAELRVVFLQANGVASGFLSATPYRYAYKVDAQGKVDISALQTTLALRPLVDAVNANQAELAREWLSHPTISSDPKTLEVAERLLATMQPKSFINPNPSVTILPLSDLIAVKEQVGWSRAYRDRLPAPQGPLTSAGQIFSHGLYAHAPASHEWNLNGEWDTLVGSAGIADGMGGSVTFTIEGDGQLLWQSPVIRSGTQIPFEVKVSGVKSLKLRTTDAGDGNRSDWALWLEPTLRR